MQVVPIASRTLRPNANQIREGVIQSYRLMDGEPGPGNFSLRLVNIAGRFFSPRHRHNFDQIRFQLAGEFDYDADGRLRPGCAGYFPEGVRYGPQTSDGDTWNLLLQFGGASGSGYMPESEEDRGAEALKARGGRFERGVYTYVRADGTKVNQDAYEAIWEHVNGRPLVYPEARYERPVLMNSASYAWVPDASQPGVSSRMLGVFSERQTKVAMHRVDPGATLALEAASLWFVLSGAGRAGADEYAERTAMRTFAGERARLAARTATEILQLRLPAL